MSRVVIPEELAEGLPEEWRDALRDEECRCTRWALRLPAVPAPPALPLPVDPPPPGLADRAVEAMDAEARRARRLAATQHVPEDYVTTVVAHLRASGYRRSADIVEDLEAERDRYRAALERIAKVRRPPNRATSWSAQPLIHALDVAREALGPTREEKTP